MKAARAANVRIAGMKAVAAYLGELLATGIGVGLDVFRFTNPFSEPLRASWYAGFDEAVRTFSADPGPAADYRARLERETWAARRLLKASKRR